MLMELALAPREISKNQQLQHWGEPISMEESTELGEEKITNDHKHRLNTSLTFDTLIEGSANRMARAAAMHVAGMPGHLYNPLFIYGGVGLGKTHLIIAASNRLLTDQP